MPGQHRGLRPCERVEARNRTIASICLEPIACQKVSNSARQAFITRHHVFMHIVVPLRPDAQSVHQSQSQSVQQQAQKAEPVLPKHVHVGYVDDIQLTSHVDTAAVDPTMSLPKRMSAITINGNDSNSAQTHHPPSVSTEVAHPQSRKASAMQGTVVDRPIRPAHRVQNSRHKKAKDAVDDRPIRPARHVPDTGHQQVGHSGSEADREPDKPSFAHIRTGRVETSAPDSGTKLTAQRPKATRQPPAGEQWLDPCWFS